VFPRYFKFAVVRDPVDRFVSAYQHLAQRPVSESLRNAVVHESGSLSAFVRSITRDPRLLDGITHLIPQHEFICDERGDVLVDVVYRFENLRRAWRDISRRLRLPRGRLRRMNASPKPELRVLGMRVPILPLARTHDQDPRQRELLRAVVRDVYARDFELFDYPR
jgi:hypothetical protein